MIEISRELARRFRAVARRCVAGRPRSPGPAIVCRVRTGVLMLWTRTETAGLLHAIPCVGTDETIVVPMDAFAAIEGPGDDPVQLSLGPTNGNAVWVEQGVQQMRSFEATQPGPEQVVAELPEMLVPVGGDLLQALHECGRTAARTAHRYVLDHLEIRGKTGQVIGTDSKQALVWGNLALPFSGTVRVPAVPIFGCRELATPGEAVRVGLTQAELVLAVGPWSIFLPINVEGKYPDVVAILPKPGEGSVAYIDSRDVANVLRLLPELPGGQQENRPVTLDLDRRVALRARDPESSAIREVTLPRSRAGGTTVRIAVNRDALKRALDLGCRALRVNLAGSILYAKGPNCTYFTAALDREFLVEPTQSPPTSNPEPRSMPVKSSDTNGPAPNGQHDPPHGEVVDLLVEAEALRTALAEVGTRFARLITALRNAKCEMKPLAAVRAGLKKLNLGGGGSS